MASIHSVTFDINNWQLLEVKQYQKRWSNPQYQEILSLTFFPQPPDFKADLSDIDALRQQSEEAIQPYDGEITEISSEVIENVPMLRQIIKVPLNNDGSGRVYIGTYAIPFQKYSYVIKIQCPEIGVTGLRESMATSELMREGKLELGEPNADGTPSQLPEQIQKLISQTTDDEKFDSLFPNHPLTRLRRHLITFKNSIKLDETLHNAEPFSI